jgi:hypothetical protein
MMALVMPCAQLTSSATTILASYTVECKLWYPVLQWAAPGTLLECMHTIRDFFITVFKITTAVAKFGVGYQVQAFNYDISSTTVDYTCR